jgi:hypothetical protein
MMRYFARLVSSCTRLVFRLSAMSLAEGDATKNAKDPRNLSKSASLGKRAALYPVKDGGCVREARASQSGE